MVAWSPAPWTAGSWTPTPNTGSAWGSGDAPSVTVTMAGAGFAEDFTSLRLGQGGSNYTGAYISIGSDSYVYFSHGGQGYDPGLSGRTGYECTITAGPRTAAQMAAHLAAVSVTGYTLADNGDGTVTISGTDTVSFGTAFASRSHDPSTMSGVTGIVNDDIETADGGAGAVSAAWCSPFVVSGSGTKRVRGLRVWVESPDASDDLRWGMFTEDTADPDALVVDFGQADSSTLSGPGWVYLWLPPDADVTVTAGTTYFATFKSATNLTQLRFIDSNNAALRGDFTASTMRQGTISADETEAWPSTWTGTFSNPFFLCPGFQLIVEDDTTLRGDASWGSLTNMAYSYGTHAANATDHNTETNIDDIFVAMYIQHPDMEGMRVGSARIAIGSVNGGVYRLESWQGGTDDTSAPHNPSVDGATLLYDYGQPTDTSTTDDYITHAGASGGTVVTDPSNPIWLSFKGSDASPAQILFDYSAVSWNATTDDRDLRADFYDATVGASGSENEFQGEGEIAFSASFATGASIDGTGMSETWPGNNPGVGVCLYVPGMSTP